MQSALAYPPPPVTVAARRPLGDSAWLGVELEAPPPGQPGVRIARVFRGSPAARAGVLTGDVVLSVDAEALLHPADLPDYIGRRPVDAAVALAIVRGGDHRLLKAQLQGKPDFEDQLRFTFVGEPAPSVSGVVTFQGEESSLQELRGRVVLLEFWASWCGVCRYLAPVLDSWQENYRPAGLAVVGVTVDSPEVGARAAARDGMGYTLVSDSTGDVTHTYLASQVPTVFVIDRRGVIVDVVVGYSAERLTELKQLVEALLAGPA